jgi:hypothetical protein
VSMSQSVEHCGSEYSMVNNQYPITNTQVAGNFDVRCLIFDVRCF